MSYNIDDNYDYDTKEWDSLAEDIRKNVMGAEERQENYGDGKMRVITTKYYLLPLLKC